MKLEPYTEELRGCPVKGNAYPVLVLGIGNPLMGDDGAGVELAHRLQERDYGPLVHVEEGGTQGMTLLPLLEDADTLILLDAVRTGALPGTVVTRSREELPRHFSRVMSPHQIGMKEVLGGGPAVRHPAARHHAGGSGGPAYGFLPPHVRGSAGSLAEGAGHGGGPHRPRPGGTSGPEKRPCMK